MNPDSAQTLALQALSFVVADEKALRTLLTQTGLTGDEMREAAATLEFQAGVLDFLMRHEDMLMAFCESEGITPDDPARAHRALSPPELPREHRNRFDD